MALTDQQIEDNGICSTCRGNGKYGKIVKDDQGSQIVEYFFCENCDGTGFESGDGDVD